VNVFDIQRFIGKKSPVFPTLILFNAIEGLIFFRFLQQLKNPNTKVSAKREWRLHDFSLCRFDTIQQSCDGRTNR